MAQLSEKNQARLSKAKNIFRFILSIIILIILIESMGTLYGVLGFVGAIVLYSVVIIILRWRNFMNGVRTVETKMFSKPLDKEYWKGTYTIDEQNKGDGFNENKPNDKRK